MRRVLVLLGVCGFLLGCGGGGDSTTVIVHKTVQEPQPATTTTEAQEQTPASVTCGVRYAGGFAHLELSASGLTCPAARTIINDYQSQVDSGDAGGIKLVGQVGSWRCVTHPNADYPLLVRCQAGTQRLDLLGTAASAHPSATPPPPTELNSGTYRVSAQVWRRYAPVTQLGAARLFLKNNPKDCAQEQGRAATLVGFLQTVWLSGGLPQAKLASDAMLYYCTQLPSGYDY